LSVNKKFHAVEFQRKVREEFSKEYSTNREAFLCKPKEKYGHFHKGKPGRHTR